MSENPGSIEEALRQFSQERPDQKINQEKREKFNQRIHEEVEKLATRLGKTDDEELVNRLQKDLTEDYAHEEYFKRKNRPNTAPSVYESGEGSEVVEDLLIEKVLSGLDSLTGINNRSSLDVQVERRQKEVKTQGEFSMIMIDIDKFKKINDTYGHQGGDYILTEVAQTLKKDMRPGDLLARYGGEEIVVIAPDANGDSATGFAERLRKKIEETRFTYNRQNIRVTISAGVSPYDENFEQMKRTSDTGLYLAKGEAEKLTTGIRIESGHKDGGTRNQVWYFDKERGEFRKK